MSLDRALCVLLPFFVYSHVNLDEEKNEEEVERNSLEVEEVGVSAESLQPSGPEESHVKNSVDSGPNKQK